MPSKSAAQEKFMRAVAHGWKPKGMKVPPVSVAREFVRADQRKKQRRQTIAHGGK